MIRFLTVLSYSMEMKDWTIWHNGNRKQKNHSKKLKKVLLFIYPLVVLILKMSVDLIIYHNVWTKIISFSLQLSIVFFSTVFKTYLLQCRALDICICLKYLYIRLARSASVETTWSTAVNDTLLNVWCHVKGTRARDVEDTGEWSSTGTTITSVSHWPG